jgi:Prp8 binding protein
MSQSKRPANDAFGSNQLVKRAKSDANLDSTAVAISSGTGQNGALIQAVCLTKALEDVAHRLNVGLC